MQFQPTLSSQAESSNTRCTLFTSRVQASQSPLCLARPSNQTRGFIFPSDGSLEKAMASHSSTLAWKLPWMEEPGRLRSMGSLSQTRLTDFTLTFHFHALEKEMATHSSVLAWRIPRRGSLVGCHLWGHKSPTRLK